MSNAFRENEEVKARTRLFNAQAALLEYRLRKAKADAARASTDKPNTGGQSE